MLPSPTRLVPTLAKGARLVLWRLKQRSPFAEIEAHLDDVNASPSTTEKWILGIGDALLVLLVIATVGGPPSGPSIIPSTRPTLPRRPVFHG
jgi:hypothetical protein